MQKLVTESGVIAQASLNQERNRQQTAKLRSEWHACGVFPGNLSHIQAAMKHLEDGGVWLPTRSASEHC